MRRVFMALLGIIILIPAATSFAGDCGDVDNDDALNILDVVYLINHIYKNGPEPDCGTVTDIDGNVYQTVTIGTQVWMAENLKVTHYRNGDPIPNVTDNTEWQGLSTGAYCNYDNDEHNVATYGRFYNWYAVDDSRNIAPEGWHVPSDAEWQTLVDFLGGDAVAGGKMKEAGYTHWLSPNTGATNESGFTALPDGYRNYLGTFNYIGYDAYFWSSTVDYGSIAWARLLNYNYSVVYRYHNVNRSGYSVRCVKD